jgi:peptide/nickel transport system ATP-binding protein
MSAPLLAVENLQTRFYTRAGTVKAVDGVSFTLGPGETLAIVGESGCGKSVTALSLMRLVADPPGRIVGGSVRLEGTELLALDEAAMRRVRGKLVSMIFQEPMTSLNPVMTIGRQIGESLVLHEGLSRRAALDRSVELLQLVGIPEPAQRAREYPHQLSGGMRQRAMIAMALACRPRVLIADEPTSALDVTIQAQILALLDKLRRDIGTAVLFITHNLGVVAEIADRVVVMYAGRVVEEGDVRSLFRAPRHPYTRGLLACLPRRALATTAPGPGRRLNAIAGQVASPLDPLPGCAFAPRCALALPECSAAMPPLADIAAGRRSRCLRWSAL